MAPSGAARRAGGPRRRRAPTAPGPRGGHGGHEEDADGSHPRPRTGPGPGPGLAELEALCVWTAERLRALTWAALVGGGYDPDVFDIALLTHRAARAGAAAPARPGPTARARDRRPAGVAFRAEGAEEGARMNAREPDVVRWLLLVGTTARCAVLAGLAQRRPHPAAHRGPGEGRPSVRAAASIDRPVAAGVVMARHPRRPAAAGEWARRPAGRAA